MNEETSSLQPTNSKCGISAQLKGLHMKEKLMTLVHSLNFFCIGVARRLLCALLDKACQRSRLSRRTLQTRTSEDAGQPVYDILNAGPRHRFCTPSAVVSNCLGLVYGQYSKGFQAYAKTFGLNITLEEADHQVKQYRAMNPLLTKFWASLELGMKQSRGQTFSIELPNGRSMSYFDVTIGRNEKGFPDLRARPVMGGSPTYYTAGKFFNNVCQGTARDVFAEKITEIEYTLGLPVVLTVHDEVLVEVDASDAKDAQREISRVMATAPQWMPDIPLASDCNIMQVYEK